ncbi:MAG: glycosyl transferase [Symbiobacteriaceae bacterium]|jgi:cellulose synthase/poly-beta-1,6-N-acetylglucosamine synthase-like glycosyltransferase|nr:glycosyl transferase [Symbiobacteriaceae bacterium]
MTWWSTIVLGYNGLIFSYFIFVDTFYVVMTLLAFKAILTHLIHTRHVTPYRLYQSGMTPPISILMPAYNEAATIVECVRSMSLVRYPETEIIVINDGSKDATLQTLVDTFGLKPVQRTPLRPLSHKPIRGTYASPNYPNLLVVDKVNGGKADALNVGISLSRCPLFCAVDADSLLQEDALERVVQPFLQNPRTVATGGFIRVVNGCAVHAGRVIKVGLPRNLVALFQIVEYLRAFYLGRMGWNPTGGLLIISGAFGLFKTQAVAEVGGYLTSSVGEDMELVVRLHRQMAERGQEYEVAFVPDPVCWTEVPESTKVLGRQRDRWHRGLLDTLIRHRGMLFRRRYKAAGMAAMPYFWLVEVFGPVIELSGYVLIPVAAWLGLINWFAFQVFLALSILFGILLSVSAVLAEELSFRRYRSYGQLLALFGIAVLENLGYRQLTGWWRLRGIYTFLKGGHQWGEMTRKGFSKAS